MTAVLDFQITSDAPELIDASADVLASISDRPHTVDAGHFESRPAAARIPLQISIQLPANYLVAALLLSSFCEEDLATADEVRQAVAVALVSVDFIEVEQRAYAMLPTQLDIETAAWAEVLRVKVAEAFAPCDPWALPR